MYKLLSWRLSNSFTFTISVQFVRAGLDYQSGQELVAFVCEQMEQLTETGLSAAQFFEELSAFGHVRTHEPPSTSTATASVTDARPTATTGSTTASASTSDAVMASSSSGTSSTTFAESAAGSTPLTRTGATANAGAALPVTGSATPALPNSTLPGMLLGNPNLKISATFFPLRRKSLCLDT